MTSAFPKVGIGLPVCNGERYIAEALSSLVSQTYTGLEITISDNASEDGTEKICRTLAEEDERIVYTRADTRLSIGGNWNRAFRLSRGEYFMWAAHDDLWEPDYVAALVHLLEHDRTALFALSRYDMIDGDGSRISGVECRYDDFCSRKLYLRLLGFLASDFAGKGNAVHGLMRRTVLERVDGASSFDELLTPGDWLLIFRLLSLGPFAYDDRLMFHKRDQYPKRLQHPTPLKQLGIQYRRSHDFYRYAGRLQEELLNLQELSGSQRAELRRICRTHVALLYLRQLDVLSKAVRRRVLKPAYGN